MTKNKGRAEAEVSALSVASSGVVGRGKSRAESGSVREGGRGRLACSRQGSISSRAMDTWSLSDPVLVGNDLADEARVSAEQLLQALNLAGNALHRSPEAYTQAFLDAGLVLVVRKLLSRPAMQQQSTRAAPLLRAALRVLMNLVGGAGGIRAPAATRALAQGAAMLPGDQSRASCLLQVLCAAARALCCESVCMCLCVGGDVCAWTIPEQRFLEICRCCWGAAT